jgi:hypothetical protein
MGSQPARAAGARSPDDRAGARHASRPQGALRTTASSYEQWSPRDAALLGEYRHGMEALVTGEFGKGLERYASGGWRRGELG